MPDSYGGCVLFLLHVSETQTCKALHELADHDHTWQSVAAACWKHLAAVERAGYRTHKVCRLALSQGGVGRSQLLCKFSDTVCGCCCPCTLAQALVLDDNRANAALALAFNNTACTYRFQQPQAFYECRLVQLQWWRAQNSLRCVHWQAAAAGSRLL
jgi:hypothetical protein